MASLCPGFGYGIVLNLSLGEPVPVKCWVGMRDQSNTLAIVVPCHNESESLAQLFGLLGEVLPVLEADYQCEVVLIDDGSTDDTGDLMREQAKLDPRYEVLVSPERRGIGAALRRALASTSARVIVNADADCTYDPRTIPQLLTHFEGHDVATGSPYHPDGAVANVPAWRLVLSRGLSLMYRWTSPVKVWTYTSMFRAYRREVLERVTWESDGFLSMTEILIGAGRAGYQIAEFPTVLNVRKYGQSKIRVAQVIRDHLRFWVRQSFRTNPGNRAEATGITPELQPAHPRERHHD